MKNPRILIIDTDLPTLGRIYFGLIHLNYVAEACNDPGEASQRAQRFRPHLVLLGTAEGEILYEWCLELRRKGVRILLMGTPGRDHSALAADGIVEGPVDLSRLHQKIRTLTGS